MSLKGRCIPWGKALDRHGYGVVQHKGKVMRAHRWVYEQCVGPIPEGMCLLHMCDNPACIRWDHMRIGTMKDNTQDSMAKGRWKPPPISTRKGEQVPTSKLTAEQVKEIRLFHGLVTQRELAEKFGVSHQQISRIQSNKHWRSIL